MNVYLLVSCLYSHVGDALGYGSVTAVNSSCAFSLKYCIAHWKAAFFARVRAQPIHPKSLLLEALLHSTTLPLLCSCSESAEWSVPLSSRSCWRRPIFAFFLFFSCISTIARVSRRRWRWRRLGIQQQLCAFDAFSSVAILFLMKFARNIEDLVGRSRGKDEERDVL